MAEAVLGLVRGDTPCRDCLLGLLQNVWQVVGVNVLEHIHLANDLLCVVAEHPLECGVCVPQGAIEVDYRDVFRRMLHYRSQPPIALRPMRRYIGITRGIVTGIVPVSIRGVHVSLSGGKGGKAPPASSPQRNVCRVGIGKCIPTSQKPSSPYLSGISVVAGCTIGFPGPLECPSSMGPGSWPLPCS